MVLCRSDNAHTVMSESSDMPFISEDRGRWIKLDSIEMAEILGQSIQQTLLRKHLAESAVYCWQVEGPGAETLRVSCHRADTREVLVCP